MNPIVNNRSPYNLLTHISHVSSFGYQMFRFIFVHGCARVKLEFELVRAIFTVIFPHYFCLQLSCFATFPCNSLPDICACDILLLYPVSVRLPFVTFAQGIFSAVFFLQMPVDDHENASQFFRQLTQLWTAMSWAYNGFPGWKPLSS